MKFHKQNTNDLIMIEPKHFGFNNETDAFILMKYPFDSRIFIPQ